MVPPCPFLTFRTHTQSNQCKAAGKKYVDCSVSKEYTSSDGTWSDKGCSTTYESAVNACVAWAWETSDVMADVLPAYTVAGTLTKTGSVEGYLGVPADKHGKVNRASSFGTGAVGRVLD